MSRLEALKQELRDAELRLDDNYTALWAAEAAVEAGVQATSLLDRVIRLMEADT